MQEEEEEKLEGASKFKTSQEEAVEMIRGHPYVFQRKLTILALIHAEVGILSRSTAHCSFHAHVHVFRDDFEIYGTHRPPTHHVIRTAKPCVLVCI